MGLPRKAPTRYFGSEACDDDAIRLARKTQWQTGEAGVEVGQGQRLIATDQAEYPLLDIREIVFLHPASSPDGQAEDEKRNQGGADAEVSATSGDRQHG